MNDTENQNGAPAPFFVYYNPKTHLLKLMAILAICIVVGLLPFMVEGIQGDAVLVIAAIDATFLIWAFLTGRRIRDRRPQVVIDTDGIYVRDWHVDIVPWQEIDFIAHSSSVRRGIVSALTRSRRGPYLLFRFFNMPQSTPSVRPPFGWLQKIWIDMELQEPAIMEYGLDTKAALILRAIQDHIAHWQRTQEAPQGETTIVPPLIG